MMNWPEFSDDLMRALPSVAQNGKSMAVLDPSCRSIVESWKKCLLSLLEIRELEEGWDGQGTPAPIHEVVDSATILAVMLRQLGVRPPTTTLQGVAGDVFFEWLWPDQSNLILEVEGPFEARVFRCTPDGEASEIPIFEPISV